MTWLLAEPAKRLALWAETNGVWLRSEGADLSDPRYLRDRTPRTRLGRLLPTLIPQLIELGMAAFEHGGVRISYPDFTELETQGIDAFGNAGELLANCLSKRGDVFAIETFTANGFSFATPFTLF